MVKETIDLTHQEKSPKQHREISPEKKKKKKKDKKEKKKMKQKIAKISTQIALPKKKPTIQEEISKGFVYKYELGQDFLDIQILPFGFEEIYLYGHREKEVPRYHRVDSNFLLGLPSDSQTQALLEELAVPIVQRYTFTQAKVQQMIRYTTNEINHEQKIQIQADIPFKSEEFIQFNDKFKPNVDQDYQATLELTVVQQSRELQMKINEDPNNLETWKKFLDLQDKLADQYNYQASITNRKLAIIERLQQQSEMLADHPWVLAYKIYMLQELNFDEDVDKQIKSLYDELFRQYIHIKPIWTLYLNQRLRSEKFIATAFRSVSVETIQKLIDLIQQCRKPQQIIQYKKIFLELIQYVSFQEHAMGFTERSVGILQGLVELNLFAPSNLTNQEQKMQGFMDFWEEYSNCKTGYLQSKGGWNDLNTPTKEEEFIGYFQFNQRGKQWRPRNSNFDADYIQEEINSLVLYEDIESYLIVFNDQQTQFNMVSALCEQLGFPPLETCIHPNFDNNYMAKLGYQLVKQEIKPDAYRFDYTDIFTNDLLLKYQFLICFFKGVVTGVMVEKFMYIKRLVERLPQNEMTLSYLMVMEGILYLSQNKLLPLYASTSSQYIEIQGCLNRIKLILKNHGENHLCLWLLYVEFEYRQKFNIQSTIKLYNKVLSFQSSKKKKLQVLYFLGQFYLLQRDYNSLREIIRQVVILMTGDQNDMSINLAIIKIKGLYLSLKNANKIASLRRIEKQKSQIFSILKISKKSLIHTLILMLDFHPVGQTMLAIQPQDVQNHLFEIESDYDLLKQMFFPDPEDRLLNLKKCQEETVFLLVNFVRFVQLAFIPLKIKQDMILRICQRGIQIQPYSLIFFLQLADVLQQDGIYFQKFEKLTKSIQKEYNLFSANHAVWLIHVLLIRSDLHADELRLQSRLGYIQEFIVSQTKKPISQLYCESSDQETFEALITIFYNYYLEKILIFVAKIRGNIQQLAQSRAVNFNLNSFSQAPITRKWRQLSKITEGQIEFV